jgi:hypothetical protein
MQRFPRRLSGLPAARRIQLRGKALLFSSAKFTSRGDSMPAKDKVRRAAKKAEDEASGVGREIKKGGRAVESELKKGGGKLKSDAKKLKRNL